MSSATAGRPKAAERIQHAAKDLFYRQGIRATGIEEVCRVADATKMSLYRAFASKDALVGAVLCEDATAYEIWFAAVTASASTPTAKLDAVLGAIAAKLTMPEYRGCPLLLAQAEFPDPAHPTHQLVAEHKSRVRADLTKLANDAGASEPEMLADTLAMLIDGAWATMPYLGGDRAGTVLLRSAHIVLRAALPVP